MKFNTGLNKNDMSEAKTKEKVVDATKNTFANLKAGDTVFFKTKGQKHGTTVIKVRLDNEGLAFKTSDGHGVTMTEKEAYQSEYKTPRNTVWTLK